MLARLRSLLRAAAEDLGRQALCVFEDDYETVEADLDRRTLARWGVGMNDALMRVSTGHGLDEAARLHVECGAARICGFLSVSGRDPPP